MTAESSVLTPPRAPASAPANGTLLAALGVAAFSFSFPGTVWALDGFGPWSATGVRGVLAAAIAVAALLWTRAPLPARTDRIALAVVAGGCGSERSSSGTRAWAGSVCPGRAGSSRPNRC